MDTTTTAWSLLLVTVSLVWSTLHQLIVSSLFFEHPSILLLLENGIGLVFIAIYSPSSARLLEKDLPRAVAASLAFSLATFGIMSAADTVLLPEVAALCFSIWPLLSQLTLSRRSSSQIVPLCCLLAISSYYGVKLNSTLTTKAVLLTSVITALMTYSLKSLSYLLTKHPPEQLLYQHNFIATIVFFIVEGYQHSIREVSEYLFVWQFPLFQPIMIILILTSVLFNYATLKVLQQTNVFHLARLENVRLLIQSQLFYFLYRYVCMQDTWKEYSSSNLMWSAAAVAIHAEITRRTQHSEMS